jgi:hypothetical protein
MFLRRLLFPRSGQRSTKPGLSSPLTTALDDLAACAVGGQHRRLWQGGASDGAGLGVGFCFYAERDFYRGGMFVMPCAGFPL